MCNEEMTCICPCSTCYCVADKALVSHFSRAVRALRQGQCTAFAKTWRCMSAEGAFGDDPKAKEDFEQLARQEMDVWKSMVSGKAVEEHMEDVYHDMIKVGTIQRDAYAGPCCFGSWLRDLLAEFCNEHLAGNSVPAMLAADSWPQRSDAGHSAVNTSSRTLGVVVVEVMSDVCRAARTKQRVAGPVSRIWSSGFCDCSWQALSIFWPMYEVADQLPFEAAGACTLDLDFQICWAH